jgi:hypothetical protein
MWRRDQQIFELHAFRKPTRTADLDAIRSALKMNRAQTLVIAVNEGVCKASRNARSG